MFRSVQAVNKEKKGQRRRAKKIKNEQRKTGAKKCRTKRVFLVKDKEQDNLEMKIIKESRKFRR